MTSWTVLWAALTGRPVQRLVIIGLVISILWLVGEQFNTWYQWCSLALILLLELLAYQKGITDGISTFVRMDPTQQRMVLRLLEQEEGEQKP